LITIGDPSFQTPDHPATPPVYAHP
jgi:hypothetical protein